MSHQFHQGSLRVLTQGLVNEEVGIGAYINGGCEFYLVRLSTGFVVGGPLFSLDEVMEATTLLAPLTDWKQSKQEPHLRAIRKSIVRHVKKQSKKGLLAI